MVVRDPHCAVRCVLLFCLAVCACHQVVDADTQKAMMAWYYKKQEQEKVGVHVVADRLRRCRVLVQNTLLFVGGPWT